MSSLSNCRVQPGGGGWKKEKGGGKKVQIKGGNGGEKDEGMNLKKGQQGKASWLIKEGNQKGGIGR